MKTVRCLKGLLSKIETAFLFLYRYLAETLPVWAYFLHNRIRNKEWATFKLRNPVVLQIYGTASIEAESDKCNRHKERTPRNVEAAMGNNNVHILVSLLHLCTSFKRSLRKDRFVRP